MLQNISLNKSYQCNIDIHFQPQIKIWYAHADDVS